MSNVTFTSGDLFESPAQTLVNATNAVGVMGGGIAKAFRERYPAMYREYREACKENEHTAMQPHFWENPVRYRGNDLWIHMMMPPEKVYAKNVLNIVTKVEPRLPSTLENIRMGLHATMLLIPEWGITSLAMPALGCGLGGCDWEDVRPLMESYAKLMPCPVEIYAPQGV
jgi:O-acetyl-ADP-ribose deacetylase (regulator of RNase III)